MAGEFPPCVCVRAGPKVRRRIVQRKERICCCVVLPFGFVRWLRANKEKKNNNKPGEIKGDIVQNTRLDRSFSPRVLWPRTKLLRALLVSWRLCDVDGAPLPTPPLCRRATSGSSSKGSPPELPSPFQRADDCYCRIVELSNEKAETGQRTLSNTAPHFPPPSARPLGAVFPAGRLVSGQTVRANISRASIHRL